MIRKMFPAMLVLALLIPLSGCGYRPKANEELYGTWTNESYGTMTNFVYSPQKEVISSGGYEGYQLISNHDPMQKGPEHIVSKWTDSEGNIWYKTFGTAANGSTTWTFRSLIELSKSATVRESVSLWVAAPKMANDYPTKIDPTDRNYSIYNRTEDPAVRHELVVAIEDGTAKDVQAVIDKGANVRVRVGENGWTVLILAAGGNKNPDVIATLLEAGADINAQGEVDGETALMHAARYGDNPQIVATLLKAGANAKLKNVNGETALDCARSNTKLEGTDALKQLEEASK